MPKDDGAGCEQAQEVEIVVFSLKDLGGRRPLPKQEGSRPEEERLQHRSG
jgi:hypothetical protein